MVLLPREWDFAQFMRVNFEEDLPEGCCSDGYSVYLVGTEVTWTGDFSWINDGDEVTTGIQPIGNTVIATDCDPSSVVVTATEITAECSDYTAGLQLDPSENGNPDLAILPAGAFEVAIVVNYSDFGMWDGTERTGSTTFGAMSAGLWALNGYQAEVPYMPYGTGISQVIYLANRGAQSGDITVDYIDRAGNSETLGVVATINPSSTLSIGNAIAAALPANLRAGGRLALTITANIPAKDGQLNSQYNVSGNRAFTLHDDNRPDLNAGLSVR
jgi:hypothetical protein